MTYGVVEVECYSSAFRAMVTNMLVPVAGAILLVMVVRWGRKRWPVLRRYALEPFAIVVVILALTSTLPVFVAQNHAAAQYDRIWQALYSSFRFLALWQGAVCLIFWASGHWLQLFSADPAVQCRVLSNTGAGCPGLCRHGHCALCELGAEFVTAHAGVHGD